MTRDIEDLVKGFVTENVHQTHWKKFHHEILKFKREHKIDLSKIKMLKAYKDLDLNHPNFYKLLVKKKMRSESGVLVVTVFTAAFPEYTDKKTGKRKIQRFSCKHDCAFCPSEPATEENGFVAQPRSYLFKEPGVLRANEAKYDCVVQMDLRLRQYMDMGHNIDKLEVLVLGGTFSEYPDEYREEFCRDIYYAANTFKNRQRTERFHLEKEMMLNESASTRVIGLTLETRPDCIDLKEISKLRRFGCTRVQMGVQHTDNKILKLCNRGHTIENSKRALKLLKDACFKVDGHFMPNLMGSSPDLDIQMLDTVVDDSDLQFDQLKIYPLQIVPYSKFEKLYKQKIFEPYSDSELLKVLIHFKNRVHPWIRLNRVIRDINYYDIISGCKIPHMRQILQKKANCRCIRCREVKGGNFGPMQLKERTYISSGASEHFISMESPDEKIIYGFVRLRLPRDTPFDELANSAFIRELHVYGDMSCVNSNNGNQHRGIGSKLLKKAEHVAMSHGYRSSVVIAGIGTRQYYRHRGYSTTTKNGYLKKQFPLIRLLIILIQSVIINLWRKIKTNST